MDDWMILLGWVLFGGTHIGLAAEPIRSTLVKRLGPGPFRGMYSMVALAALAFLIYSYWTSHPTGTPILAWGAKHAVTIRLGEFFGIVAFVLLLSGFFNRTLMSMAPGNPVPHGITRITRHPMNMAFALFAIGHLLTNRFAGDWIFWGGFVIFGCLASLHQDGKIARNRKGSLEAFIAATSIVPFAAILAGRQSLKLAEVSRMGVLLGILAAVAVRLAHFL